MNWKHGFSATYYMTIVDRDTWDDVERIEIKGASVSRSDSNLIESADIDCKNYDKGEQWVRLWLDARQKGSNAQHVALFTGLATSPNTDIDGIIRSNKLECYSVLKPADDYPLPRGYFVPKNSNVASLIKNELLASSPAPVIIDGEPPSLASTILAENGETPLTMSIKLLDAINWRFRIDGNGTIHICPKDREVIATFDPLDNDVVEPQMSIEYDWFKCPNGFSAIIDGTLYTAIDDNPASELSTVTRGRRIEILEDNPALNTAETATQYVKRRLAEEQTAVMKISYNRRFYPGITVGDYVSMNFPAQNVVGVFKIMSNGFDLNYGATVSENANKISNSILGD